MHALEQTLEHLFIILLFIILEKNGMNRNIQIYYCNSFLTKPCSSNVHYHMTSRPGLKYHHAIKSINNWFTDFRKRYDVHNNVAYMMTKV